MPRGVPQIEVTFDVDANGILNVSAMEKSTGKSQKITITNDKGRLSKEEVERLVEEAAKHEAEDKAQFERVEAKNQLESYLYNSRNSLQEAKEKLGEEATSALATVEEGIKWLDANQDAQKETYADKQKEYTEKIQPTMMKLYAQEPNTKEAPSTAAEPGPKVEEVD
jgi:L1 cell adhesion molecule like protein